MQALEWKKMILRFNNTAFKGRYKGWYMFEAPTSTAKHVLREAEKQHPHNEVDMETVKRWKSDGIAVGLYRIRAVPTIKAGKTMDREIAGELVGMAKSLVADESDEEEMAASVSLVVSRQLRGHDLAKMESMVDDKISKVQGLIRFAKRGTFEVTPYEMKRLGTLAVRLKGLSSVLKGLGNAADNVVMDWI